MKPAKNQAKQIRALKRMKGGDIDFTDIPQLTGAETFVVAADQEAGGWQKQHR